MHIIMQSDNDYKDGAKYTGTLRESDGIKNGQGNTKLADGGHYTGQFREGEFGGSGVLVSGDGTRYEGQFQNGKAHGMGVISKPGGLVFCGEFRNGSINGKGLMTFPSGEHGMKRQEGVFENGILTKMENCHSVIDLAKKLAKEANSIFR